LRAVHRSLSGHDGLASLLRVKFRDARAMKNVPAGEPFSVAGAHRRPDRIVPTLRGPGVPSTRARRSEMFAGSWHNACTGHA
jgi:hypothetical protein